MSSSANICTSAKLGFLQGVHSPGDSYKIAFYTEPTVNYSTEYYTSIGECVGSGYVAGGYSLSGYDAGTVGISAVLTFDGFEISGTDITFSSALIYNSSKAGAALVAMDFGGYQDTSGRTISVKMPANLIEFL